MKGGLKHVLKISPCILAFSLLFAYENVSAESRYRISERQNTEPLSRLLAMAEGGSVEAMEQAAGAFLTGQGAPRDLRAAASWYLRAAERGSRDAQAAIATLYYRGIGVKRDDSAAFHWYEEAAKQGDVDSAALLALFLTAGIGTAKDESRAFPWLEKGSKCGPRPLPNVPWSSV